MAATDAFLLDRWAREHDAEAFREILERHAAMVFATARRILGDASTAEDVTQDCFLRLVETPRSACNLPAWLHRAAVNRALDVIRAQRRRRATESRWRPAASGETAWNDVEPWVDRAIEDLPDALRVPLVLHFLQNKTHEAIALHLGIAKATVAYRIAKAIEMIRSCLRRRGIRVAPAVLAGWMGARMSEPAPSSLLASLGKAAVAAPAAACAPPVLFGGIMKLSLSIAAGALILAGGLLVILRSGDGDGGGPPSARNADPKPVIESPPPSPPAPAEDAAPAESPATAGSIRGRVIFADGRPVAEARIELTPPRGAHEFATAKEDGGFTFETLELGDYTIEATVQGTLMRGRGRASVAAGRCAEISIAIPVPKSIRVRVVDVDSQPIEAMVEVHSQGTAGQAGSSRLTKAGEVFDSGPIPPEAEVRVFAARIGYRTTERVFSASEALPAELTLVLTKAALVSGRVVDGERGVPDARIEIISIDPDVSSPGTVTTGPDGAFSFPASAAGEYWLRVDLRRRGGVFQREEWPIEGRDGIVLSIDADDLIEGGITDPQGRPLPRVKIAVRAEGAPFSGRKEDPEGWRKRIENRWHGTYAVTDAEGHFAIGGLPEAKLEVRVPYPEVGPYGHGPWRGRPLAEAKGIAKGRRDIELIARGPALWIRFDSKTWAGEATVDLWAIKPSRMGSQATAVIEKLERESFAGFYPPGKYRVSLWGPACPLAISDPFDIEEGSPVLLLSPGTGVPLRIRVAADDTISEPLTVYVSTEIAGIKPSLGLKTETDGTLLIASIGPGSYTVSCYREGARGSATIEVGPTPPDEVILQLSPREDNTRSPSDSNRPDPE